MLRLLSHPNSTFGHRIRIALAEKGVSFEEVTVRMEEREHRGDAFKAKSPYGRVPVLEDGEFVIYESTAILEYLDETADGPKLMPDDAKGRALVRQFIKAADLELATPMGPIIFPKRFIPETKWRKDEMAECAQRVGRHLGVLSRALGDAEYLVGDAFGMAEVAYAPFLAFLPLVDTEVPENVNAYRSRLLARPSVSETKPGDTPA